MNTKTENITIDQPKQIKTSRPVLELVRKRWSPRSFSDRKISRDNLNTLFEAARLAPSSRNEQPWEYIYAHKNDEAFRNMLECLNPGNKEWAKNAAVLVISLARKQFSDGRNNKSSQHDTGLANMQLVLQAMDLGIFVHMMAGFHMEKTIETLAIPKDFEVICFMAIGYRDNPNRLPEPYRSREMKERTRKNIDEFAFHGQIKKS